jgi:hypothetical protein
MLAHYWGLKTFYYSLINKAGSKQIEETKQVEPQVNGYHVEEFDDEEALAESVELQRIKGLYDSKIGGDDGAYTRSPALTKPKVVQTGANPVNFTSGEEKGRSAPSAKQIPGQYKNAAGIKSQDGESAPKATTSQASGVNTKSPVAESKRTTRKPVARQYK